MTDKNLPCITEPDASFEWLVKFIEDVKQISLQGDGLAHEAAAATCESILTYAKDIARIKLRKEMNYLDTQTKCEKHGFYSWIRTCPYCTDPA